MLDPTTPPGSLSELTPGTLRIGDREEPCHAGQLSERAELDYWDRRGFDLLERTVGPVRHTSMWLAGADDLVASLPVRPDHAWTGTEAAVPVEWRGERGEVWAGSLMLVDQPPTEGARTLAADLFREVWVIGEWTLTVPKDLADAVAAAKGATVGG